MSTQNSPEISINLLRDFVILTLEHQAEIPAVLELFTKNPEKLQEVVIQNREVIREAVVELLKKRQETKVVSS